MNKETRNPRSKKVQVVVFLKESAENYVLMLQTNKRRGEFWQNITGGVDQGESFTEAASRELIEETKIESQVNETDLFLKFHDQWQKDVTEQVFWATSLTREVEISSDEHQDYKWINIEEISKDSYKYPSNFEAFKECLKCFLK